MFFKSQEMKKVTVVNLTRPLPQPLEAGYCVSFLCQLRGLTFRQALDPHDGLVLVQTHDSRLEASIHMMGVSFDLAIIWINSAGAVVDRCLARRWRPAYFPKAPARFVLEIVPERMEQFQYGDEVRFDETLP